MGKCHSAMKRINKGVEEYKLVDYVYDIDETGILKSAVQDFSNISFDTLKSNIHNRVVYTIVRPRFYTRGLG